MAGKVNWLVWLMARIISWFLRLFGIRVSAETIIEFLKILWSGRGWWRIVRPAGDTSTNVGSLGRAMHRGDWEGAIRSFGYVLGRGGSSLRGAKQAYRSALKRSQKL